MHSGKMALIAIAALAIPAAGNAMQDKDKTAEAMIPSSVIAFNQKASGDAVKMTYVYLPFDGYVAIYTTSDGKVSGDVLGYVPLAKGDHRDVAVKLSKAPEAGSQLVATLYKDVDGDKKLDKKTDTPVWSADSVPTESHFKIDG